VRQVAWYSHELDELIIETSINGLVIGYVNYDDGKRVAYVSRDFVSKYKWMLLGGATPEEIASTIGKTKSKIPENLDYKSAMFILDKIQNEADVVFKNAGTAQSVAQGATQMDKDVARAAIQMSKDAKEAISEKAMGVIPEAAEVEMKASAEYATLKELQDEVKNLTKSGSSFLKGLKSQDPFKKNAIDKLQTKSGLNLEKTADEIQAFQIFSNPSAQIPAFGGSNTARTLGLGTAGAYAGSVAGQAMGSGTFLPTIIGAGLGSLAGSPVAIRKYMQMNKGFRNLPQNELYKFMPYMLMNANQDQSGGNK